MSKLARLRAVKSNVASAWVAASPRPHWLDSRPDNSKREPTPEPIDREPMPRHRAAAAGRQRADRLAGPGHAK